MTTNPYAEAAEAARLALQDRTGRTRQSTQRDAETAVDAATPHLLAPVRELAKELVNHGRNAQQTTDGHMLRKMLDAIEEGSR